MVTSLRRDEEGFTIVELMIALTLLSVVLTTLASATITMYRATNHVTFQTDDQNQARTAISVLSRDIRAAAALRQSTQPAFLLAAGDQAAFTANLQDTTRPVLVRLRLDTDSRFLEDTTPPQSAAPGDPVTFDTDNDSQVRYIAAFVVNEPGAPIFRYFDKNGDELVPASTTCPVPGGPGIDGPCLDEDQRLRIATVELSLTIGSAPHDLASAFTVSHRARLPNAF